MQSITFLQVIGYELSLKKLSDADIPERQRAGMVTLQRKITVPGAAKIRIRTELTGFHFCFPVRTPQLELEKLYSVEPVFHMCATRYNACVIPLADRFQVTFG